jgi:protein-disulfide isomerase
VAIAFVHFPLDPHPQSHAAARVAECAGDAGHFSEAVDYVFAHQDSLGKKPWTWFALGAGLKDTLSFNGCMADTARFGRIRSGVALGNRIGISGTPSIILNGWRYGGVPQDSELVRAVGDLLAGKAPYNGYPRRALTSQQ